MKILVTGGCGFIGSNFIRYWLKNHPDDEIINVDVVKQQSSPDALDGLDTDRRYKFVKGDICDYDFVVGIFKQAQWIEMVVHFAAETHVDRSIIGSEPFVQSNIIGTYNLIRAAVAYGARFHHVSTDEVFGQLPLGGEKFNEDSRYDPRSPYAATKAAADHLVRAWYHTHGLKATISNCSNNFGPWQYPEKLVPKTIANILTGKKVPVYGDGLNVRDWLDVQNHCSGIDFIITHGKIGETYCIGGCEMSNLELINFICSEMSVDTEHVIEFIKDRPGHDRRYAIDSSKIEAIGWRRASKEYTKVMISNTIDWYIENQWWWINKI